MLCVRTCMLVSKWHLYWVYSPLKHTKSSGKYIYIKTIGKLKDHLCYSCISIAQVLKMLIYWNDCQSTWIGDISYSHLLFCFFIPDSHTFKLKEKAFSAANTLPSNRVQYLSNHLMQPHAVNKMIMKYGLEVHAGRHVCKAYEGHVCLFILIKKAHQWQCVLVF